MTAPGSASELVLPREPAWFRFRPEAGGSPRLGIVDPRPGAGDAPRFVDLGPVDPHALLVAGGLTTDDLQARAADGAPIPADALARGRLLQPVPHPRKVLCLAKNYVAHAREFGAEAPKEPIFFAKLPDSLCGPGDPVVIPHWLDTRVDHEAELALVLVVSTIRSSVAARTCARPTRSRSSRATRRSTT